MQTNSQKLAIVSSRGQDDERGTVAWTVANAGVNSGQQVTMFLVSSAVDTVRKGAVEHVRMNPFDPPMGELISTFMENGGRILACPPCTKVRGYSEEDLIDGVQIVGSNALHALIRDGASTLSF